MGNGIGKLRLCYTGDNEMLIPDDLGHSFCYIRPQLESEEPPTTSFKSISGAAVSANTSTALSTDFYSYNTIDRASAFEGSTSFSSIPLQPIPRYFSGPIFNSGRADSQRGFMSGPIERALMSDQYQRSYSHAIRNSSKKMWLIRALRRALSKGISRGNNSIVAPIEKLNELTVNRLDDDVSSENMNLQWAQGKAGEDRAHVVVSDEHGWVFVGIYDGFNGPDAPDYLVSNLYSNVHKKLKGLLWDENDNPVNFSCAAKKDDLDSDSDSKLKDSFKNIRRRGRNVAKRRWRCVWDRERMELDRRLKGANRNRSNHGDVLKGLSEALRKTEEGFLDLSDRMVMENPELALMGSCVLVMLMKGDDVYVMNVGDSRAVLGKTKEPDLWSQDLERISEEEEEEEENGEDLMPRLSALQLSNDHTTSVHEEVMRIKEEHPDDMSAVINDRVKGSLKVTRALGAGFLKQPKLNNALLEMFRIEYIGTSSYINCLPSLHHHRLGPRDRFLILSSDGLYQYFTNEEAVSQVELFVSLSPEEDPAQHLVEELLFRAAKRAGMDFHELLEIPQGDRRRYHDDVSIIVISLEGRIWKSCA